MAITYPLTPPATPRFASMTWRPDNVVALEASPFTRAQTVYDWGGRQRLVDLVLPTMGRASYEPWAAFFLSLKGRYGTFNLGPPPGWGETARGIATGTPLVKGAGQSGETLLTDGWTATQTGILKAGDWFALADALYRVLADANSDGSGNATFDIWPALRAVPADNAPLDVTAPKGIFRLADNGVPEELAPVLMRGFEFTAMEAF